MGDDTAGEGSAAAQQLIENYNNELQSFYRNPSYNQASRVAIDAAVVRNLRTALDEVVTKATGTKYQALRNQYGALKTIENDVTQPVCVSAMAALLSHGFVHVNDRVGGLHHGDVLA